MLTPWLVAVLSAPPVDGGRPPALTGAAMMDERAGGADGGLRDFIEALGGCGGVVEPEPDVVTLGPGVTSYKTLEDAHQSACGYEMYFHTLEVSPPDGGWTGFLGYSGASGCPRAEWNDVDTASLVNGTIRVTSGSRVAPHIAQAVARCFTSCRTKTSRCRESWAALRR